MKLYERKCRTKKLVSVKRIPIAVIIKFKYNEYINQRSERKIEKITAISFYYLNDN